MAINLDAIRKRIAEMSGGGRSSIQIWKPVVGKHKIRGLPWKSTEDGIQFCELRFYYIGENPRILAPAQFGKPDPVADLIRKCYSSNNPDDRLLAKKLYAKPTAYMPIIDRAAEDKGVQLWGFNPFIHQRLLGFFTSEDIGDILDPLDGFDLDVEIKPSKKMFNDKPVLDTVVDAARRSSKLSNDSELAKKWLDGVPDLNDLYQQKTTQEIEQILNTWLAGGAASVTKDEPRGATKTKDVLDQLADEIKTEVRPVAKQPTAESSSSATRPTPKKRVEVDSTPAVVSKKSLDDAFAELMEKDDD